MKTASYELSNDTLDYHVGRDVFHEHVKEYKLAFSNDGSNFRVYQENGKEKVSLKRPSVLMFHS